MSNNSEVIWVFFLLFYFNNFPYRFHTSFKRSREAFASSLFKESRTDSRLFFVPPGALGALVSWEKVRHHVIL